MPPRNTQTHKPLKAQDGWMSLVPERPHNKYGSAILIRDDLKVDNVYERVQGAVELITIVMSRVVVHYVYKPPNDQFAHPALGHRDLPHIVQWADSCDLTLIQDTKRPKSFNSARWKKGYNPDLIFGMDTQRNLISLLKTLNLFQPTTSVL